MTRLIPLALHRFWIISLTALGRSINTSIVCFCTRALGEHVLDKL
jgi:hypothetical protein